MTSRINELEQKIKDSEYKINSVSDNKKLLDRVEKIERFLKKELWYDTTKTYRNSDK